MIANQFLTADVEKQMLLDRLKWDVENLICDGRVLYGYCATTPRGTRHTIIFNGAVKEEGAQGGEKLSAGQMVIKAWTAINEMASAAGERPYVVWRALPSFGEDGNFYCRLSFESSL